MANATKVTWTDSLDKQLLLYIIDEVGTGQISTKNWETIAAKIPGATAGGISQRYSKKLKPSIKASAGGGGGTPARSTPQKTQTTPKTPGSRKSKKRAASDADEVEDLQEQESDAWQNARERKKIKVDIVDEDTQSPFKDEIFE